MSKNIQTGLSDTAIAQRNEGFEIRQTPCCTNLYNDDNQPILALNMSSALIWENCNGDLTIRDMINQFHQAFDEVPYEDLERDVMTVIQKFQEEKVISLR